MSARDELDGLIARLTPRHGRDGRDGRDGNDGADGQPGERGERGPVPKHVWSGTALKIEQPGGAWAEPVELKGDKGEAGYNGQDGRDGVDGKDGAHGKDGGRGSRGEAGKAGEIGPRGPQGPIGPMPEHEWDASRLRFELAPNVWGKWTDLRGPAGRGGGGGGGGMSEEIADLRYLQLAGGTLTGALVLNAGPVGALDAATKQYVDAHAGGGGSVSGLTPEQVTIGAADGTLAQAAQLSYADAGFADGSYQLTLPNYVVVTETNPEYGFYFQTQDVSGISSQKISIGTGSSDQSTGGIDLVTGNASGSSSSGEIKLTSGSVETGNAGRAALIGGDAVGGVAGGAQLIGGNGSADGLGGIVYLAGGSGAGTWGSGGNVSVNGGSSEDMATGGHILLTAGYSGSGDGGNIQLSAGGTVSGLPGQILLQSNTVASGSVTLAGDPVTALEAATKQYVDAHAVSPLTTKGDLFAFSTVDARLGVGGDGQVLTADATQTTGLKWAAPTGYTDEQAQDAIGGMLDTTIVYTDATPLLSRAALTGAVTAASGSNTTALGSFTKAQLDAAISDGNALYVGDVTQYTDEQAQDAIGAAIAAGTQTGITVAYNDAANKIDFTVTGGSATVPPYAYKNAVMNGAFDVWQRGTSFTGINATVKTADRWAAGVSSTSVWDVTSHSNVPTVAQAGVLVSGSALWNCTTAKVSTAATEYVLFYEKIEGYIWRNFAQRALTLSFWVYSNKTGIYCINLTNGGADRSYIGEYTINVANTWEKKTISIPASPSAGTWNYTNGIGCYVIFALACGSTFQTAAGSWTTGNFFASSNQTNLAAAVNNNIYFALVQLETGSTATDFAPVPFEVELARCRRYYQKAFMYGTTPAAGTVEYGSALQMHLHSNSSIPPSLSWKYVPEMRTAPTVTTYNPRTTGSRFTNSSSDDSGNPTINVGVANGVQIIAASNLAAGVWYLNATADAEL